MSIFDNVNKNNAARDFLSNQIPKDWRVNDKQKIGINGFTLYVSLSETVSRQANITELPVEDGSVIGDHIIKMPVEVQITGTSANIHLEPNAALSIYKKASPVLGVITSLLPPLSAAEIKKRQQIIQKYQEPLDKLDDLNNDRLIIQNFLEGKPEGISIPEYFLSVIEGHYLSPDGYKDPKDANMAPPSQRRGLRVEALHRVYENMYVTSYSVRKDNTAEDRFDFSVSFKHVDIAKTETSNVKLAPNPAPGTGGKTESGTNSGSVTTSDVSEDKKRDLVSKGFDVPQEKVKW